MTVAEIKEFIDEEVQDIKDYIDKAMDLNDDGIISIDNHQKTFRKVRAITCVASRKVKSMLDELEPKESEQ